MAHVKGKHLFAPDFEPHSMLVNLLHHLATTVLPVPESCDKIGILQLIRIWQCLLITLARVQRTLAKRKATVKKH
ncbi:hypothetical protein VCRA2123O444_90097 [Vibrio crassostreae]|nr:hypothetical protein VCRA2119O430_100070 [Vibrio crassostreae]CAK1702275.1 hypothetical protein VCRA2113O409_100096 [Vibrio crassostreae]CAK1716130.1 hypothetical protein VCRA2117O428_110070 [Vibrio crassostreae]CAK1717051.1 hypothetical protein VCRA2113O416_110069 [Vibrio crassostreae]CAK1719494.1 hypothetical protein VCRA2113O411_110071 [Vibrio crassostreae]